MVERAKKGARMGRKTKVHIGIEPEFLEIIQLKIEKHEYSSISHAVNYSLSKTLKRYKKDANTPKNHSL